MNILSLLVAFIEWFDAAICISFSDILYQSFFPNVNHIYGLSLSLALISISCLGKPIGAYLFGGYSDSTSRISASYLSFYIMIVCSIFLIFLPSYHYIGYFSTLLFFLIKFIQGIAIGGNYSTSVYSIERSTKKYYINSLTSVSIFLGFLFANLFNAFCMHYFSTNFNCYYSWRLGFLLSGILSIPVLFVFKKEIEKEIQNSTKLVKSKDELNKMSCDHIKVIKSSMFEQIFYYLILVKKIFYHYDTNENKRTVPLISYIFNLITSIASLDFKVNLLTLLLSNKKENELNEEDNQKFLIVKSFIKVSILCLLDIIPFQYFHVFLPNYKIIVLGLDHNVVRLGSLITLSVILIVTPLVGALSDKKGPGFFLKLSALMMMIASSFNYFNVIQSSVAFHLVDIYFGLMMGLCYGTLYCYIPLALSPSYRAKIAGLALNSMTSLILVLTPVFSSLIESNILSIFGVIGFLCLSIFNSDKNI